VTSDVAPPTRSTRFSLVAALAIAIGCGSESRAPSRIDVTVQVDPALGLDRITLNATAAGKEPISQDLAPPSIPSSTIRWTILVVDLRTALDATIVANGFQGAGTTALVSATASAYLQPGETVAVTLRLDANCAGISCPANQTCKVGDCVPTPVFGDNDGGTGDGGTDTCAPCPNGFGCVAGVCKTTCATSSDCHPDYFCDVTNAACHSDVVSVACGSYHTCAALKDGRVICWGDGNSAGVLGIGTTDAVQGAVQVVGVQNAAVVKANEYSTCVLTAEKTASCWGNYFSPATETFLASTRPIALTTSAGQLTAIKFLELGFDDGCAVTSTGTYCWGSNIGGTLGIVGGDSVYPATLLIGAGIPSLLGMGYSHQVAAYGATSVCPWGTGYVKAGDPNTVYVDPQGQCFDLGAKIAQLALGESTTCVRLEGGAVVCWGINNVGQVGSNASASSVDPPGVQVPGVNASDIAAGIDFTCAIPSASPRTLTCWGHTSSSLRVIAPDLPASVQIVKLGSGVKAYATCGILSDGGLLCWDAFGTPQAVPRTW